MYKSALRTDDWFMTTDHEYGSWELFDLTIDPTEFSPLISEEESPMWPALYERLDQWSEAQAIVAGAARQSLASLSERDRERLRALGYIQ